MSKYEEIKAAIIEILREHNATADKPTSMFTIGIPLVGSQRFTQDDVVNSLFSMQSEGLIKLLDGNRLHLT
jgi:hypothetical protein